MLRNGFIFGISRNWVQMAIHEGFDSRPMISSKPCSLDDNSLSNYCLIYSVEEWITMSYS